MTKTKALLAMVAILVVSALYTNYQIWHFGRHLARDEHATCIIQARGLPAGHHLSASLQDISKLLQSLTPAKEAALPPAQLKVLLSLRSNAAAYVKVESHQPPDRSCS